VFRLFPDEVLGRYVRNLWIGSATTDVRNSGYYVASTGTVKSVKLLWTLQEDLWRDIHWDEQLHLQWELSSAWMVWDAGETRLQGGKMQGSSGSTEIGLFFV
jgi:hypothetical protein